MLDSERPLDPKDEKRLKTRGIGSGEHYEPFIKVHEISSTGESYRIFGRNSSRPHHLLSRLELSAFLVFDRYRLTSDIKEQFPLPVADSLSICKRLGIKHPQVFGKLKVVTTDLVIEFTNRPSLAVAVKYADNLDDPRAVEKLQIEKVFWEEQGYEWKLFTEYQITPAIKENLEWLHAAYQNSNSLYTELSDRDIRLVVERLSGRNNRLSTACSALDDEYSCEPGFHIGVVRKAVAANLIDVPLDKVFRQWLCSDISLVQSLKLIDRGVLDVS
jgi:hypothetical protein